MESLLRDGIYNARERFCEAKIIEKHHSGHLLRAAVVSHKRLETDCTSFSMTRLSCDSILWPYRPQTTRRIYLYSLSSC